MDEATKISSNAFSMGRQNMIPFSLHTWCMHRVTEPCILSTCRCKHSYSEIDMHQTRVLVSVRWYSLLGRKSLQPPRCGKNCRSFREEVVLRKRRRTLMHDSDLNSDLGQEVGMAVIGDPCHAISRLSRSRSRRSAPHDSSRHAKT
jgi:hypothetical protein